MKSSTFTAYAQLDGRKIVVEIHIDLVNVSHQLVYTAGANDDLAVNLAAHAAQLDNDLSNNEIIINVSAVETIGSLASPTFIYSTAAQNLAALRVAYKSATQVQAVMVADFLNTLTATQLQNIFALTTQQTQNLMTNILQPAAITAAAIRAAAGQ